MSRNITYDSLYDRLVFLKSAPNRDYWEQLWRPMLSLDAIRRGDRFVTGETLRVLTRGARVVDAGCGIGATVHGLANAGFDAHGIDYAQDTVTAIRALVPKLQIQVADVRALPFGDTSLDGVWSLGVIEHFYNGFDPVIIEAHRVLRAGGYLFLTVPVISPLKALKIRLGVFPDYDAAHLEQFFQFAFRPSYVAERVAAHGFNLQRSYGRSGAFGLTEDAPRLARALMLKLDRESLLSRAWWRLIDRVIAPFSQHTRYYLFQKI